jgi:hypothetical protein
MQFKVGTKVRVNPLCAEFHEMLDDYPELLNAMLIVVDFNPNVPFPYEARNLATDRLHSFDEHELMLVKPSIKRRCYATNPEKSDLQFHQPTPHSP